jgi:hypothetical protein
MIKQISLQKKKKSNNYKETTIVYNTTFHISKKKMTYSEKIDTKILEVVNHIRFGRARKTGLSN